MPGRAPPLYRRGKYWVDKLRREDGEPRSPNWYVFWYDPEARREAGVSTGTDEDDRAILACDQRYLADKSEGPAFCHACGQPLASAEAYLLADAIADYKLEWGELQSSAVSIAARLKHVLDFMAAEASKGGIFGIETSCAVACGAPFIAAFRAWSKAQPVTWRNKAGQVTASRTRSPATTEESVLQLAAVLNHAADADPPRSERRPVWRPLPRKQVSRPRRQRAELEVIAEMLRYAAEPDKKRGSLHAFLIGSICTIARPDAVVDICVAPDREQWHPGSPTLDLNQFGRAQTKKYRPTLPVLPLLAEWLLAEHVAYHKLDRAARRGAGYLVNYFGRPVKDVDTAWATMLRELKLPSGREWKSYLLRHSLATLLRNRGVAKWDLEGFMGHSRGSTTEIYAVGRFGTVTAELQRLLDELDGMAPGSLRRNCAEPGLSDHPARRLKMTG